MFLTSGHAPVLIAAILLAIALPRSAMADEPLRRHAYDERDVRRLGREHPHALEALERGEEAMRRGAFDEAAQFFASAAAEAPGTALVERRTCQAWTALGRRDDALAACRRASDASGGSAIDLRATVAALLTGDAPPTPLELGHAIGLAERARESMPAQPYGYAALCDVAMHLGDDAMVRRCLDDLERVAPRHGETARVRAWLSARAPSPWRLWIGWGALGLAGLGTLLHALRRRLSTAPARARASTAALTILGAIAGSSLAEPVAAQPDDGASPQLGAWQIDDENPEATVPPPPRSMEEMLGYGYFLMDLSARAEGAAEAGDHRAAIRYYRALVKAVPDRAVSDARLCESYEAIGERANALEACRSALTKGGVRAEDYDRHVRLLLGAPGDVGPEVVQEIDALVAHLQAEDTASQTLAHHLACELGARLRDEPRLTACTTALAAVAPNDPKTISFRWALAMQREDLEEARALVERAKTAGAEAETVRRMEEAMAEAASASRRLLRYGLPGLGGIALLVALVLLLVGRRPAPKTA